MDRFDPILFGKHSSATERDHLKSIPDYVLVSKAFLDYGLESGAVDVTRKV